MTMQFFVFPTFTGLNPVLALSVTDGQLLRIYDGKSSMRRKSSHSISVAKDATAAQVVVGQFKQPCFFCQKLFLVNVYMGFGGIAW